MANSENETPKLAFDAPRLKQAETPIEAPIEGPIEASAPATAITTAAAAPDLAPGPTRTADAGAAAPSLSVPGLTSGGNFPVVGIGASAGGLAAFKAFFSGMPSDDKPGMAFVLIQHLAPDHKSLLSELIQRCTRLAVFEVTDGMRMQVNCVYVIPPNCDMAFLNGSLQLMEPAAPRGHTMPIDFFFRSLAQDQRERAIGVVLSGTGSDGMLGLRAIKSEGGLAMAQTPDSAEFDGMPSAALATGLVDYELPPIEMVPQLMTYVARAFGRLGRGNSERAFKSENELRKIFILLREHTGHDFSQYKPSTVHRRIDRRMAVQQIDTLTSYVRYLQRTPQEVEALFRDLLIGVTSFFRDPDAFHELETQVIPKLFEDREPGAPLRIWVVGCSTGEEAYSIAILLVERMEAFRVTFKIQLFATDIDSRAIATARLGRYPASVAADMSPQRFARFFTPELDGNRVRINKSIRDLLVFSEHDLIKDPPFSRLDLVTCRNLLIYMDGDLQKKVIPLFHYALNPGGRLFLGSSEGVGEFDALFAVLDRKAKLFQRRPNSPGMQRAVLSRMLPSDAIIESGLEGVIARGTARTKAAMKPPLRELTEQALLQQFAPASALVNERGDILYLHGRTGMYLEPSPGEVGINNILKMARQGLGPALTSTLHKAVQSKKVERADQLSVKTNGHFTRVNLSVCPVNDTLGGARATGAVDVTAPLLFLVMLADAPEPSPEAAALVAAMGTDTSRSLQGDAAAQRIAELQRELRTKDDYLQSTHEELESSNEELKSANEEMQSVNEELQSTNEELETSKEELQSVNEELATVNTELQDKVTDLSRANNDMNNLLAGTGIGTVFVNHQLRILRFTPAASSIINLIPSDVGRPVGHIVSNLVGYDSLIPDVQYVLDTLTPKAIDVQTKEGRWYTMRIQPYRTLENVIEGAVISFVDVTELKQTTAALTLSAKQLARMAVVVRDAFDAITVQDLSGKIMAWNPAATRMYGWSETEALQMNVRSLIPEALREQALQRLAQMSRAPMIEPYRTERLTKEGAKVDVAITSTALLSENGQIYAIATTERAVGGAAE